MGLNKPWKVQAREKAIYYHLSTCSSSYGLIDILIERYVGCIWLVMRCTIESRAKSQKKILKVLYFLTMITPTAAYDIA
jgi:hypothetical protein